MTILIDLPESTLAALRADAGAQGRPAEQVASEYLSTLYAEADTLEAAVDEALDELEAGKGRSLTEFAAESTRRFSARYGVV